MQRYRVTISEIIDREYEVDATSPEAAQAIAEEYWNDGEQGTAMGRELLESEAIPLDLDATL